MNCAGKGVARHPAGWQVLKAKPPASLWEGEAEPACPSPEQDGATTDAGLCWNKPGSALTVPCWNKPGSTADHARAFPFYLMSPAPGRVWLGEQKPLWVFKTEEMWSREGATQRNQEGPHGISNGSSSYRPGAGGRRWRGKGMLSELGARVAGRSQNRSARQAGETRLLPWIPPKQQRRVPSCPPLPSPLLGTPWLEPAEGSWRHSHQG